MTTRGINDITGTVHEAKHDGTGLIQECGIQANQTLYLDPTDEAVTCKRCLNRRPARVATRKPVAASGNGPTTWGIFDTAGQLVTYRTTRRDALAAIERIGDSSLTAKRL